MKCYHATSGLAAEKIEKFGFKDGTGSYMTDQSHTGVWIADRPLDENDGAISEALFEIEIDEADIAGFEWIEEGKAFREFLVPAAILNRHPRQRL